MNGRKGLFRDRSQFQTKDSVVGISLAEVIYYVREKSPSRVGLHDPDQVPE
jgi:hypothetical protein